MNQEHRLSRGTVALLTFVLVVGHAVPSRAYQTYGVRVGDRVVTLKWNRLPVRYAVTDRGVSGVSATQFRDAVARGFAAWEGVPGASVSAQFVGFTSADPFEDDGQTTLGFMNRPDLDRVLGATEYLIDIATGEVIESDIFFNSAFSWSVSDAGESGRFDVESIVVHETGHLFGLGHSSLGETELRAGGGRRVIAAEAVMFPIAFTAGSVAGRQPRADDMAGMAELYPASDGSWRRLGSISGRITRNGQGVFGAHIVAFNPNTGRLVGNLSVDRRGSFAIASLEPGAYVLRVEPLDDADLASYFGDEDIPAVDLDFRVTYYQRLVTVPEGGGAMSVEIAVTAK